MLTFLSNYFFYLFLLLIAKTKDLQLRFTNCFIYVNICPKFQNGPKHFQNLAANDLESDYKS